MSHSRLLKHGISSLLAALAVIAGAALTRDAAAQSFPNKTITMIYNFPAGGFGDALLRMMGTEITKATGQPVIVDIRPGASGRLGLLALAKSRGDGHLVTFLTNGNVVTLPLIDTNFKMEPGKDYTPVCLMMDAPYVLVVNPTIGVKDLKGMIAYFRANPGKVNVSAGSIGGMSHLANEMVKEAAKVDFVNVPYKGNAPSLQAVVANEVVAYFASSVVKPLVDSGRVVPLATTGAKRWQLFPNLPTFQEQGFPGFDVSAWLGLGAPADLPPEVAARLNALLNASLKVPEVAARVRDEGWLQNQMTVEGFTAYVRADIERWAPIVRRMGIKPE